MDKQKTETSQRRKLCLCTFCRQMLYQGDKLAEQRVYKLGELKYISLAHDACAPEDWVR